MIDNRVKCDHKIDHRKVRRRPKSASQSDFETLSDNNTYAFESVSKGIYRRASSSSSVRSYFRMGNSNKVSSVTKNSDRKTDPSEGFLPTDKISAIAKYFRFSATIFHSIEEHLYGSRSQKITKSYESTYDLTILIFSWIIFHRNLSLAYFENLNVRAFLGESSRMRPARQMVMAMTIWSIYSALIFTVYYRAARLRQMSWLMPFLLLCGQSSGKSHDMDVGMIDQWYNRTMKTWNRFLGIANVRCAIGLMTFVWIIYYRWNRIHFWINLMNIIWSFVLSLWCYYSTTAVYITYIYFDTLCHYFRIRFNKINGDIESIIAPNNNLKPSERATTLHHVLVEHNDLCRKVSAYNKFWGKWLMATYFFLISVICFTTFQAFFTTNNYVIRAVMFIITLESSYLMTKVSVCASLMSNAAHASYNRLIRVTFDKYPVDLQIQLRMFIQRLSGPQIGFYCLDLFEITYTTYAGILAALGQNFLLIVDFVRSYAEVGKEAKNTRYSFSELSSSVFNSTLSVFESLSFDYETAESAYNMSQ